MDLIKILNENPNKCRTCLSTKNCFSNISNTCFLVNETQVFLSEMLELVTSIQVNHNDGFSNYMCDDCQEILYKAYQFREYVLEVQQSFWIHEQKLEDAEFTVQNKLEENEHLDADENIKQESKTKVQSEEFSEDGFFDENDKKIQEAKYQTSFKPSLQTVDPELVQFALEEQKSKVMGERVCSLCDYISKSGGGLSKHIIYIHKEIKDKWCRQCFKVIETMTMVEHKKWHRNNPKFECAFCSKKFHKYTLIREHIVNHSSHRPHMCRLCNIGFPLERNLRQHMRTHRGEKRFQCELCYAKFGFKSMLEKHVMMHGALITQEETENITNEESTYLNPFNDSSDSEKTNSRKKIPNSNNSRKPKVVDVNQVMCDLCGLILRNLSRLNLHKRKHREERKFKCEFCVYKSCRSDDIAIHRRKHTNEKPKICHICGKAFAQTTTLKTHMKLHTGRPEQCKICKRRFCRPSQLKFHMRQHTGDFRYTCQHCDAGFFQLSHLKYHILAKHSEERPFSCAECGLKFKSNTVLQTHVLTHSQNKPIKCKYCNYQCSTPFRLKGHMESRHKREQVGSECPKCGECFSNFDAVRLHCENEHQVVVEKLGGQICVTEMS